MCTQFLEGAFAILIRLISAAILAIGLVAGEGAWAQDYGRVAPKPPPAGGSGAVVAPAQPNSSSTSSPNPEQRILDRLRGLRLVDAVSSKVQVNGSQVYGVTIDGPALLADPAIQKQLADGYIGKPLTRGGMQRIQADIAAWYRDHDRPFVDVSFPQQDITSGVLQAVVTAFRRGKVKAVGNEWIQDWLLTSQIGGDAGQMIDASALNADVAWLNENPFRQTYATLDRGSAPGTADIVLHTTDRIPFRVYATYDNTGLPAEGANRWGAGFVWGNAFFLDQIFSYQFTSSDNFWEYPGDIPVGTGKATLAAHSVNDTILLPWHDKLVIFGLYEQDRPLLGSFLSQVGASWQASVRYETKFAPVWGIQQDLQAGFDFKRTNNNFAFGGFNISASETDIAQFIAHYTAAAQDGLGQTSVTNLVGLSPGRLTPDNNDAAFQPAPTHFGAPDAQARYAYDDVTLTRIERLPGDFSGILRLQGQVSTSNLLPSEELNAGGLDSVRGYDQRAAAGSLGGLGTVELRTPPVGPVDKLLSASTGDQLQFDTFFDGAYVRNNQQPGGSTPPAAALMSAGIGAHYTLNRFIDFRFENGWQLREAPGQTRRGSRMIFSVVVGN